MDRLVPGVEMLVRFGLVTSPHACGDNLGCTTLGPCGDIEARTTISTIGKDFSRIVWKRLHPAFAVMDVGRRDGNLLYDRNVSVGADVRLEAVDRRLTLVLDAVRLIVVLAGRSDDRGIYAGSRLRLHRLRPELRGRLVE